MLMLAGMAMVATLQFRDEAFKLDAQRAAIAGQQMRMLDDAVEGYLTAHARPLRMMADDDCGGKSGCTATAVYCSNIAPVSPATVSDQCELGFDQMIAEGFLPPNWNGKNIWGAGYKTVVTRVLKINAPGPGNEMDYNLRAITVTDAPWTDASGTPLLGLLGQAVKAGGSDLGMTSDDSAKAQGLLRRAYNSGMTGGTMVTWSIDSGSNSNINAIGLLAARAGFESSANNAFPDLVKRDGSRMMRNALDMNGNRINNVQDAYIKKISGGRNLAAIAPTWVFKYSWRIDKDGDSIEKPDCRAQSRGFPGRTSMVNPWDSKGATGTGATSYDNGEPRILIVNDYLYNMKALGYYYDASATCANALDVNSSPASNSSCPANDPYSAYDPVFRARAKAAYVFYAVDAGSKWDVFMRYYQNEIGGATGSSANHNAKLDATNSQGIASIYCYYDNKPSSGCNGEQGCVANGTSQADGSAAAADLTSPPSPTTADAYQDILTSSSPSQSPSGMGATGAADVVSTF